MNLHVPHADTYVVAVSGGVDSMVLLDQLRKQSFNLIVLFVRYDSRSSPISFEMDQDNSEQIIRDYCDTYEIELCIRDFVIGKPTEKGMRDVRWAALWELAKSYTNSAVVFGHHKDDNIATVLMRILRGTGIHGLTGMSEVSTKDGVEIFRPFLNISKKEILDYANMHNIEWFEDPENKGDNTRAVITNQIIPLIEMELGRSISQPIHNLMENARTVGNGEWDPLYRKNVTPVDTYGQSAFLVKSLFFDLPTSGKIYFIREMLKTLKKDYMPKRNVVLELVKQLTNKNLSHTMKPFPLLNGAQRLQDSIYMELEQ